MYEVLPCRGVKYKQLETEGKNQEEAFETWCCKRILKISLVEGMSSEAYENWWGKLWKCFR